MEWIDGMVRGKREEGGRKLISIFPTRGKGGGALLRYVSGKEEKVSHDAEKGGGSIYGQSE